MTLRAKWMLRRPLMRKPAHCKYTRFYFGHSAIERLLNISESVTFCLSLTRGVFSLSPFQGSMEAEENSPSASTPASPQPKTPSEGELSTTAAELLQDYMTTVWWFYPVLPFLAYDIFSGCTNTHISCFFFFLLFSCGQNCRHKRSSSLPPCFMNTATDPPSMSSALTFGNSMGTAGSSFYLVWTLFSFLSDFQCSAFVFCLMIWTGLILNYGYTGVFSATL